MGGSPLLHSLGGYTLLKKLLKTTQFLAALAASAALIAGCGGGQNSTVMPGINSTNNGGTRKAAAGHRIFFYSRSYLKTHPSLAPKGPHARALHTMATSSNNLAYNGGPIQKSPKIYLIFWGWSSANDTTHDPDGMAQYLVNYVNAIGGSNLANVATQYYSNTQGNITNPTGQLAGTWYDSSLPPQNYADSDIQSEAGKAVAHFGYNADANYFVVTPTGYTTSGFGSQWCAYHNSFSGSGGPVAYTDFPYVPDAGSGCGQGSVNSPGTLDGASIVGGHEMQETITDPGAGNGWLDSSGQEIGDKCAWTNLQNVTMSGGAVFPNQPEWSNAISGCAFSYGTSPTPSPTASPTPVPTSTPAPTPSPTGSPAPGCSGQLLLNPGFESGSVDWSSTSGVINTDGYYAHSGNGYAWLDGYGYTHTDTLSQSVNIPAGCKATLTYWLMIQTQESGSTAYDTLKLTVNGTQVQSFSNVNAGPYTQETVDLSSFAGSTAKIQWTGTEDASLATSFFIDDTALNLQ